MKKQVREAALKYKKSKPDESSAAVDKCRKKHLKLIMGAVK